MLTESFRFAWQALNANRLRSTLSLLGISIGIFSVITVFTIVDSWEYKLKNRSTSSVVKSYTFKSGQWSFEMITLGGNTSPDRCLV